MSNRSKPDYGFGSRKRKERYVASGTVANKRAVPQPPPTMNVSKSSSAAAGVNKNNNWLLGGYLAQEFLTGGTLLGQKWDPARAEANPITPRNQNSVKRGPPGAVVAEVKRESGPTVPPQQQQIYADVSNLLMKSSGGAHIDGVVNPTQLAKWLHS